MKVILVTLCLLASGTTSPAQTRAEKIPASAVRMLDRRFPSWKFADVNPEVQQYFREHLKGASLVVVSGDFDGDRRRDYATLIRRGYLFNSQGQAIGPRHYLVVFLRRNARYKMHVIKDPAGDYLVVLKKGTEDYNYEEQREITYANDAIFAGIFEKAGTSYVYKKGRFISFVSAD